MILKSNYILRETVGGGAPGGGGAPADWRASIPEDIRGHASLKDIQDVPSLVKSYVHAQSLIGADKILKPQQNWTEQQWTAHFNALGRPEKPDGYSFKVEADKLPQGLSIDDNRMVEAKLALHKLGLSDKQAAGALQYYLETMIKGHTDASKAAETSRGTAMQTLRQDFGANFENKVELAKAVVRKFGGEELKDTIDEVGNHPGFIKLFAAIGEAMMDDTARGQSSGLIVTDSQTAMSEINQLKGDGDFMKALGDRQNPGHKAAVERWTVLHEKAYPSK